MNTITDPQKIKFTHEDLSVTLNKDNKLDTKKTINGLVDSRNNLSRTLETVVQEYNNLVDHVGTLSTPNSKEVKELPQPKEKRVNLQENIPQTYLFERKALYAVASLYIKNFAAQFLPLAIKNIAYLQTATHWAIAISAYLLLNKLVEKLIEKVGIEAIKKFCGKVFEQFKSVISFCGNCILKGIIKPSAKLASYSWAILKLLIKVAIVPVLSAIAAHLLKPEWNTTATIISTSNDVIAQNHLDAHYKNAVNNPVTPYVIGTYLTLICIGVLKNGYDWATAPQLVKESTK